MPLEPALQSFVDAVAAQPLPDDLLQLRALSEQALPTLQGATEAVSHVVEHVVSARDGHALVVRLYTPAAINTEPRPALLFAHGGGWFQCSLAVYDGPCRALANASGHVIAAVGYRLAPEHPFPTPLHDVADAWLWLQAHAAAWASIQRVWSSAATAPAAISPPRAACCCAIRDCRCHRINCCCTRHWMAPWPAAPTASSPTATTSAPN